jgi:hypothetical protein
VAALPQLLSQIATLCVEPDAFNPANDPGAPATACGQAVTGIPPNAAKSTLVALVRLLGRQAARELFLAPVNDDAA